MVQGTETAVLSTSEECVVVASDCHKICTQTSLYCHQRGGRLSDSRHMRILRDCAVLCAKSVDFLLRRSDLADRVCQICAEACERCAESCDRYAGDEQLEKCAEICLRCARLCEEVAAS